jgi:hypothetical protein
MVRSIASRMNPASRSIRLRFPGRSLQASVFHSRSQAIGIPISCAMPPKKIAVIPNSGAIGEILTGDRIAVRIGPVQPLP